MTIVVTLGTTAAFSLVWVLTRSVEYRADQVLLSPSILAGEQVMQAWNRRSFVFQKAELQVGKGLRQAVPLEVYERFYHRLHGERSVHIRTLDASNPFSDSNVIRLFLVMTAQGPYAAAFGLECEQEIQIALRGGWVRVQIPNKKGEWAYFQLPGIERELLKARR